MKVIKDLSTETGFPYIAFIPKKISSKPALLIQLHGAGERGYGDESMDFILVNGLPNVVNDENLQDCILVMPRCPSDTFWVAKIESLRAFIERIINLYSIDTGRIYLCGLSMGGFGTWYMAMAYPDLFTAIAPCCGGGMAWNAHVLSMPVWAFHGKKDTVVSPIHTLEMIEQLKDSNPNLKYDLYEDVEHDSWKPAFTEELIRWFMSFRK